MPACAEVGEDDGAHRDGGEGLRRKWLDALLRGFGGFVASFGCIKSETRLLICLVVCVVCREYLCEG